MRTRKTKLLNPPARKQKNAAVDIPHVAEVPVASSMDVDQGASSSSIPLHHQMRPARLPAPEFVAVAPPEPSAVRSMLYAAPSSSYPRRESSAQSAYMQRETSAQSDRGGSSLDTERSAYVPRATGGYYDMHHYPAGGVPLTVPVAPVPTHDEEPSLFAASLLQLDAPPAAAAGYAASHDDRMEEEPSHFAPLDESVHAYPTPPMHQQQQGWYPPAQEEEVQQPGLQAQQENGLLAPQWQVGVPAQPWQVGVSAQQWQVGRVQQPGSGSQVQQGSGSQVQQGSGSQVQQPESGSQAQQWKVGGVQQGSGSQAQQGSGSQAQQGSGSQVHQGSGSQGQSNQPPGEYNGEVRAVQDANFGALMQWPGGVPPWSATAPRLVSQHVLHMNACRARGEKWSSEMRGRWFPEEVEYFEFIFELFRDGLLKDAEPGITFREFISELLQTPAMRVSKKFTGDARIGHLRYPKYPQRCMDQAEAATKAAQLKQIEESYIAQRTIVRPRKRQRTSEKPVVKVDPEGNPIKGEVTLNPLMIPAERGTGPGMVQDESKDAGSDYSNSDTEGTTRGGGSISSTGEGSTSRTVSVPTYYGNVAPRQDNVPHINTTQMLMAALTAGSEPEGQSGGHMPMQGMHIPMQAAGTVEQHVIDQNQHNMQIDTGGQEHQGYDEYGY